MSHPAKGERMIAPASRPTCRSSAAASATYVGAWRMARHTLTATRPSAPRTRCISPRAAHRVGEELQRLFATDDVERRVGKRQGGDVAVLPFDRRMHGGGRRACHPQHVVVDVHADDPAGRAGARRGVAGDDAGAAGGVEHAVGGSDSGPFDQPRGPRAEGRREVAFVGLGAVALDLPSRPREVDVRHLDLLVRRGRQCRMAS